MPRLDTLRRVVAGLGLTMPDLYRTQQTVAHLPDGSASDEARAAKLTPEERRESARKAAQARWLRR